MYVCMLSREYFLQHESSEGTRMDVLLCAIMSLLLFGAHYSVLRLRLAAHCTAPSRQCISVAPFSEVLIRRISEVVASQRSIVPALHFSRILENRIESNRTFSPSQKDDSLIKKDDSTPRMQSKPTGNNRDSQYQ
jgi:hypothetical protein